MKNKYCLIGVYLISLILICGSFGHSVEIMKFSELRSGMKGIGKTIFKNTK